MNKIDILKNYILNMKDFAASQNKKGDIAANALYDGYVLACTMILEQIDTL